MNYLRKLLKLMKIIKTYGPSHVLKMYWVGIDYAEVCECDLIEMHQNSFCFLAASIGFNEACSFLKLTELEIENLSNDFNELLNNPRDYEEWSRDCKEWFDNHKGYHFDEVEMSILWVFVKTGRDGLTQCFNELERSRESREEMVHGM